MTWMLFIWFLGHDDSLINAGTFQSKAQCEAMAHRIVMSIDKDVLNYAPWYCIEVPK